VPNPTELKNRMLTFNLLVNSLYTRIFLNTLDLAAAQTSSLTQEELTVLSFAWYLKSQSSLLESTFTSVFHVQMNTVYIKQMKCISTQTIIEIFATAHHTSKFYSFCSFALERIDIFLVKIQFMATLLYIYVVVVDAVFT
jgi:hypothetical protein